MLPVFFAQIKAIIIAAIIVMNKKTKPITIPATASPFPSNLGFFLIFFNAVKPKIIAKIEGIKRRILNPITPAILNIKEAVAIPEYLSPMIYLGKDVI